MESKITSLLLGSGEQETSNYPFATAKVPPSAMSYAEVENFLLRGKREEAVKVAIEAKDWALAMLIAGNCRAEVYQDVVKRFAEETFPPASSLQLMSALFSNQAQTVIKFGGKRLSDEGKTASKDDVFLSNWRRNLAALLSNKTPNWRDLVEGVGLRLQQDAHVL